MNKVALSKQAWHLICNPDSKWGHVLKGHYFPNVSFWDVSRHRSGSWIWRSLLVGRDFLKQKCYWVVGDGASIHIWEDK